MCLRKILSNLPHAYHIGMSNASFLLLFLPCSYFVMPKMYLLFYSILKRIPLRLLKAYENLELSTVNCKSVYVFITMWQLVLIHIWDYMGCLITPHLLLYSTWLPKGLENFKNTENGELYWASDTKARSLLLKMMLVSCGGPSSYGDSVVAETAILSF